MTLLKKAYNFFTAVEFIADRFAYVDAREANDFYWALFESLEPIREFFQGDLSGGGHPEGSMMLTVPFDDLYYATSEHGLDAFLGYKAAVFHETVDMINLAERDNFVFPDELFADFDFAVYDSIREKYPEKSAELDEFLKIIAPFHDK